MMKDTEWKSISIHRGGTAQFNTEKFKQPKRRI
jgi:hypothetical protein